MPKPNFYYVGDCGPNYFIECKIAYWIWRVIPFILLVIGTCGNILNIVVLSGNQLRKYSTSVYILILAIAELGVLWTSLLPDTILSLTGYRNEDNFFVICKLRYWLMLTSGSLSTWILVLLTVERIMLTKAPHFSKRKLTPRAALVVTLIVLFVIGVANSHMIYGNHFYDIPGKSNISTNENTSDFNQTVPFRCYFVSPKYKTFYEKYWQLYVLLMYNLIPATIIIIGNIKIAMTILFRRNGLISTVRPIQIPAENIRKKSAAKLLLLLGVFYVITTTPYCVYYLLRGRIADLSEKSFARWQLATAVVNILLWCNFSFNFFFYFMRGTLFKKEWNRLVQKVRSRLSTQTQTSS